KSCEDPVCAATKNNAEEVLCSGIELLKLPVLGCERTALGAAESRVIHEEIDDLRRFKQDFRKVIRKRQKPANAQQGFWIFQKRSEKCFACPHPCNDPFKTVEHSVRANQPACNFDKRREHIGEQILHSRRRMAKCWRVAK